MDRDHFPPNFNNSVLNLGNSILKNPNYAAISADYGFFERAARFSSKDQLGLNNIELEKKIHDLGDFKNIHSLRRNCSNAQMEIIRPKTASPNEGSSVSEQIPIGEKEEKLSNDFIYRKRKLVSKGKYKKVIVDDQEDRDSKRCKTSENKGIGNGEKQMKQNNENGKTPEPPKDYIHVRARRGQATDSHSLAERVRREKISERMKFLQDLVPGCNKVTGKALMLDEIINYVQSLQCQVEYLSVKLASVDTLDFNTDSLLSKEVTNSTYQIDSSSLFGQQKQEMHQVKTDSSTQWSLDPSDTTLFGDISLQLPFVNNSGQGFPQFSGSYEDDLQSIVDMGFGQNPSNKLDFHPQSFPGLSIEP